MSGAPWIAAIAALAVAAALPAGAAGKGFPPPPRGPHLGVSAARLDAALSCPAGFSHPGRRVVLLIHGTSGVAALVWPDGMGRSLALAGFDWCMVQLPERALGDIQVASEYVVQGIRSLARLTGSKVDVVGYSQGAVEARWALEFWPDLARDVDDLVTVAGANNAVYVACPGHCAAASWQMRQGSGLEAALNAAPPPPGPSYTAVYSLNDGTIVPASSGTFAGARNIHVQSICPNRAVTHLLAPFESVNIAVAVDALTHRGPASAARVSRSSCHAIYGPGITTIDGSANLAGLYPDPAVVNLAARQLEHEPPLRSYARGR